MGDRVHLERAIAHWGENQPRVECPTDVGMKHLHRNVGRLTRISVQMLHPYISRADERAIALPGYTDYCRHQQEIWNRAEEWARCVENSKYYPYQHDKPKVEKPLEDAAAPPQSYNKFVEERARERLCFALADLLNKDALPFSISNRFDALTLNYGFSGQTLYRHRDLWHPEGFHSGDGDGDGDGDGENFPESKTIPKNRVREALWAHPRSKTRQAYWD